jgi:carbonic anhydrase
MMEVIEKILLGENLRYQLKITQNLEDIERGGKIPKCPVLIFTCMDPRIDVHRIFQLQPGDVFVLRNAGNVVTKDIIRSILIAIHEYNIKYIIVLGHLNCGMTKVNLLKLKDNLSPKARRYVCNNVSNPLVQINKFFKVFKDELKNVNIQVEKLKKFGGFPVRIKIIGMIYDINTGFVFNHEIVRKNVKIDNFRSNYKDLLLKKELEFAGYKDSVKNKKMVKKNINVVSSSPAFTTNIDKKLIRTHDNKESFQINKPFNRKITQKNESDEFSLKENLKVKIPIITPKISIPKIFCPKVKISVPIISKKRNQT